MVKLSNSLVGILNLVAFLLSVPFLGALCLSTTTSNVCEKFLGKPLIVFGVFLVVVSLAGFIGACCRVSWLLCVYLLLMSLLIVLVFCSTIFTFVVTNKGAGEVVSGRGHKEYRLGNHSNWLQKSTTKNWGRTRSCLIDRQVCKTLSEDLNANNDFNQFVGMNLSPIQSGCCTPPAECAFTYQNATMWSKPANASNSTNPDCTSWNNQDLCFNCQSCKAGFMANTNGYLKKGAIVNIILLIFFVIVYSIGCCAFRNNRHDNSYPRWK